METLIKTKRKPYTLEEVTKEALKYTRRVDFQKKSNGHYAAALNRFKNLDEVCKHMGKPNHLKRYTKEEILRSAKKYTNQRDWFTSEPSVFRCARGYDKKNTSETDKEFWRSCISHMDYIFKPNGYWTYDRSKEETLKYKSRDEFIKNNKCLYNIIIKRKWSELLNHMDGFSKPKNYWTYDRCKEEALKYDKRSDFSKESGSAYNKIKVNGWKELLEHMKPRMTLKQRVIYSYEFSNSRIVYVGLTCEVERRHNAHMGKEKKYGQVSSPVFKLMEETGEIPKFKILSSRPIKEENAPKSEKYYVEKYKKDGWTLLNRATPGSLGSCFKWTKEKLKSICESCTKISELRKKVKPWVIQSMRENGWFDELTSHMVKDGKKLWTDEEALKIAYQYDNLTLLRKEYNGVAKYIFNRPHLKKQLDEYLNKRKEEIILSNKPKKEEYTKIASKYTYRIDFKLENPKLYRFLKKNGLIDEVCKHMMLRKGYWTYDRCKEEALKYSKREDIHIHAKGCHVAIYKNKWFELLPPRTRHKSKWTYEKSFEESKKYKSRYDFKKGSKTAYEVSRVNKWLDIFYPIKYVNQYMVKINN